MKAGLDIAFFGSSLVSAYWNGAATYYRGIVRALHERGHRVTFYEPDAFGRQQHRDMDDPEWATVVVYAGEGDYLVARDGEEMRRHMRAVLEDAELAAELRRRGLETIAARHTCAHRVDELLAIHEEIA